MGNKIGYIIMPRDLVNDKWIIANHFNWWFILVSMASHTDHKINVKRCSVHMSRGELCASIRFLCNAFGTSDKSSVNKWIHDLEDNGYIKRTRPTYRITIIEIIDYNKYCPSF